MVKFTRGFGVHSDLKHGIRLLGPIYLLDACFLAGGLLIMGMGNNVFKSSSLGFLSWIFNAAVLILVIYSLMRPRSNPGKRNYELLILTFTPSARFFQSISDNSFLKMNFIRDLPNKYNRRMYVNKKYRNGGK